MDAEQYRHLDPKEKGRRLRWAAVCGEEYKIRDLLAADAEVDCADENGVTALMEAAWHNKWKCMQLLLAAEAKADRRDSKGTTALMKAAGNSTMVCVEILLAAGANPTLKDDAGQSARDHALNRAYTYNESYQRIADLLVQTEFDWCVKEDRAAVQHSPLRPWSERADSPTDRKKAGIKRSNRRFPT